MNDSTNVAENLKWLVLVPTKFEHQYVSSALQIANSVIEICGFGPVVPAARTVQLIQRHDPDRVLLIGIAGTYGGTAEVGSASSFSKVACYGIGAGSGETFQTAQEMGWNHWDDEDKNRQITDVIPIVPLNKNTSQILTVCSAAEDSSSLSSESARSLPDACPVLAACSPSSGPARQASWSNSFAIVRRPGTLVKGAAKVARLRRSSMAGALASAAAVLQDARLR